MTPSQRKASGSYYTPDDVAQCLARWVVRTEADRLLDPSCGDGRFIAQHANTVGIEQDAVAAQLAIARAPWALVHEGDFFSWASHTHERFECAAGNPPFIRYQTFRGEPRQRALNLCASAGARFSGLSSSWAPFIVATATLLKAGGRLAFVVPAEIGHAPYSAPLLEYLCANFGVVHVIAVRQKLFPKLSEDCWLLYAEGYGRSSAEIRFSALRTFTPTPRPPISFTRVALSAWRDDWNCRLRPFVLTAEARDLYAECAAQGDSRRLGDLANVGIGYVSGANDFFHLRPSEAASLRIPKSVLHPTVRNGRALPTRRVTNETVENWFRNDEEVLLLRIGKEGKLPISV
ncbi:MAG TPA: N-6 DNA methylase, partial [Rhodanobacteraceae bacterium]|nr:N-6 DNA methylase [Rhodanobacteraceae bacterium]